MKLFTMIALLSLFGLATSCGDYDGGGDIEREEAREDMGASDEVEVDKDVIGDDEIELND